MNYKLLQGNNVDVLKTFPDDHFDSIVTDPPYGLSFLGKAWDANTGSLETYQECLRVLKPGGHILAFSAARTYHHLAVTIEQAGFEIRDQIMWIYSSGFPKSQDIGRSIQRSLGVEETAVIKGGARPSDLMVHAYAEENEYTQPVLTDPEAKAWSGWGTQLKPAHEPIVLARKPIRLSIAKNCQAHGVGALNIDAGRVPYEGDKPKPATFKNGVSYRQHTEELHEKQVEHTTERTQEYNDAGRFPSNVLGEIPDYQKYFYWPKVSRRERHIGHELPKAEPLNSPDQVRNHPLWEPSIGTNAHRLKEKIRKTQAPTGHIKGGYDENGNRLAVTLNNANLPGNNHPTVKPIELMKYLIRLITPAGGHVLDPFNGSGSTGCAAVELDFAYTGIELDPKYIDISERRIESWYRHTHPNNFGDLFEVLD
jgi:site-specific DNA-methyltransferase (adenine-specific)